MATAISHVGTEARGPEVSRTSARLSVAAAALFLALLGALHLVKPGLDPSWRFISEYAIGEHGWIMVLAFIVLGVSCVALFVAIRSEIRTRGGRIGLGSLLVGAAGMLIAAAFTADPITARGEDVTTHGTVHGVGTVLGTLGIPIASALITRALRRDRGSAGAGRSLLGAAVLAWIGLLVFELSFAILVPGRDPGPDVPIGWPNRFLIVTYALWLIVVARHATRRPGAAGPEGARSR